MAGERVVMQLADERAGTGLVVLLQAGERDGKPGAAARLTNLNTCLLRASLHETSAEVTFQARAALSHKPKHLSQKYCNIPKLLTLSPPKEVERDKKTRLQSYNQNCSNNQSTYRLATTINTGNSCHPRK